jgi:dipeptidyl aminopeptidase/acylaminoacyl peptidase
VGVSGAPVVDLIGRANRIEPYMGTPAANPDGFARASNVALADRLRGKLMIAIGTSDSNVTFTHSMRMVRALVDAGKDFELVVLPGETHLLTPAGQRYYVERRARFFEQYLK